VTGWKPSAAVNERQPSRVFLDGHEEPRARPLALFAGPLSLQFDDAGLRYVCLGEREVVRRIYAAVRDENWGTAPATISDLRAEVQSDSFVIEFDARHVQGPVDFAWYGKIIGTASGRVTFTLDGLANTTFQKNRIGFCVLHPLELAGQDVEIVHADGRREAAQFPRYIAPQNPFLDVVGLAHAAGADARVTLHFDGDVFETEDQRNWIDASFKTFCTPLSRPFPAEIRAGERVRQEITLVLEAGRNSSAASAAHDQPVLLTMAEKPAGALPRLGFDLPADSPDLTGRQSELLRLVRPAHLRCELRLGTPFVPQLERAAQTARQLGAELDLVLFVGPNAEAELAALLSAAERLDAPIAHCCVFPAAGWSTTEALATVARKRLRQHDASIPVGGGTVANFLELNRQRPPVDALDFVTWSLQPQEHAFDNASLVETLAAHAAAVESARQFSGDLPLVVGPITFKKRVNPYATGAWPPAPAPGDLPLPVDVRQLSLFGASWTLGSIKYLAEAGVAAATYYELAGWKGLIEYDNGSPLPAKFPSLAGGVFPLFHVFADLAELPDAQVIPVRSSAPLRVEALAIRRASQTRLLVANFTDQSQSILWPTMGVKARGRVLDASNVLTAMNDPTAFRATDAELQFIAGNLDVAPLPPFAIARIDLFA